jgi:hypothetical protein
MAVAAHDAVFRPLLLARPRNAGNGTPSLRKSVASTRQRCQRLPARYDHALPQAAMCCHMLPIIATPRRNWVETTRQGVRTLRPTRPAGPQLHSAGQRPTRDDGLDFAPWHAPREENRRRIPARQGTRRTKPVVVVAGRRRIVVAVGRADVRRVIVERAATQHTATRSSPSGSRLYRTDNSAGDRYWLAGRGRPNS